jgi:hypothetical protein
MNRRLKFAIVIVGLALLVAGLWRPVKVMWHLAALERAGGAEIWVEFEMPGWMPKSWQHHLHRKLNNRQRSEGWALLAGANLALGGELRSLRFNDGIFHRHVPELRERFPDLRDVGFSADSITEADVTQLCTELRAYPSLEEISLSAALVTDAALAPLAGHPRLKWVWLNTRGTHRSPPPQVTSRSADTFASMPALRAVTIEWKGDLDYIRELERLQARLPQVRVDWR